MVAFLLCLSSFFFFNDTATTEIYTLSLHDALPISSGRVLARRRTRALQPDLPRHHRLKWQLDIRSNVADQRYGPAFTHRGDRGLDRVGRADGFERGIRAGATGSGGDLGGGARGL